MTVILFLIVVAVWLTLVLWLSKKAASKIPKTVWRLPVGVVLFAVLFPLPLIDEIVGGWQFRKLCEANVVRVNKETARGRTVYNDLSGHEVPVLGTWVKVWMMTSRYLDVTTGELILSFDQLRAEGEHLFPGFDSGHDPLTFRGTCAPPNVGSMRLYTDLGLTLVRSPQSK